MHESHPSFINVTPECRDTALLQAAALGRVHIEVIQKWLRSKQSTTSKPGRVESTQVDKPHRKADGQKVYEHAQIREVLELLEADARKLETVDEDGTEDPELQEAIHQSLKDLNAGQSSKLYSEDKGGLGQAIRDSIAASGENAVDGYTSTVALSSLSDVGRLLAQQRERENARRIERDNAEYEAAVYEAEAEAKAKANQPKGRRRPRPEGYVSPTYNDEDDFPSGLFRKSDKRSPRTPHWKWAHPVAGSASNPFCAGTVQFSAQA